MSWYTPANQQVIDVARMMVEQGMTLSQACQALGIGAWTSATFSTNVARVLAMAPAGSTTAQLLQSAQAINCGAAAAGTGTAVATTAGTAVTTSSSGGLVALIAAHPAAFVGLLLAAGIATYFVSGALGAMSADEPSAVLGTGPDEPPGELPPMALQGGGYLPVLVTINGAPRIVSVRSVDAIKAQIPLCNFRHGGINCDVKATLRILDRSLNKPFENSTKATEALCKKLDGPIRRPRLAAGFVAMYNGKQVTVDDYGGSSVNFEVCRRVIR